MKTFTTIFSFSIVLISTVSMAQEKTASGFEPIREELTQWDVIRGPWLASSMEALANNEPIPQRTFPENFTPNQMLRMVDPAKRTAIQNTINEQRINSGNPQFWNRINRTMASVNCSPRQARTYGDPHMISFDGARYSFQTVGEFVLAKSNEGDVEIQARQKPQNDDFSLNTAVAMNVAGDRLAIYAEDYPDADYSTPVRLNGRSLQLNGSTYFLDHGGTIQKSGESYFIHWPNGESAEIKMRRSGSMEFMDVSINILPCVVTGYNGVLGNADGIERNDFDPGINVPLASRNDPFDDDNYFNRERQAYIAKVLADQYRVDDFTTLFDYSIGRNTASYTDRSFPRVYRSINDLDQRSRDRARQRCEQNGISARDMNGCIFDQAYLSLDPPQPPRNNDPVAQNPTLRHIDREVINRNPVVSPTPASNPEPVIRDSNINPVDRNDGKTSSTSSDAQPKTTAVDKDIRSIDIDNDSRSGGNTSTPTTRETTTPVYRPSTIRTSEPRNPTPTTRPTPTPPRTTTPTVRTPSVGTPKPTPAARPTPKPTIKTGKTIGGRGN